MGFFRLKKLDKVKTDYAKSCENLLAPEFKLDTTSMVLLGNFHFEFVHISKKRNFPRSFLMQKN